MESFFETHKVLNSVEAEDGAKRLGDKLDSGELMMDILPNSFENYTGKMEENNFISYCAFLDSKCGRKVIDMLEEIDGEQYC